jgi:hypothetical protein
VQRLLDGSVLVVPRRVAIGAATALALAGVAATLALSRPPSPPTVAAPPVAAVAPASAAAPVAGVAPTSTPAAPAPAPPPEPRPARAITTTTTTPGARPGSRPKPARRRAVPARRRGEFRPREL